MPPEENVYATTSKNILNFTRHGIPGLDGYMYLGGTQNRVVR